MWSEIWFSTLAGQYACYLDGRLWAADAIPAGDCVYRARVTRRAPSLGGVFADVGERQVLVSCGKEPLPEAGAYLYVYEVEPPEGHKLAVCKRHPVVAGEYVLYYPDGGDLRFARAVDEETRRLCVAAFPTGVGCLVRSKVGVAEIPSAVAELASLMETWRQKATHVGVGLVHRNALDYERFFRGAIAVRCDDAALATRYGAQYDPDLAARMEREVTPVLASLGDRVRTEQGVELVIDKTEACWVIDVNGKDVALDMPEDNAALYVNRLAATEALRQICLRNMTGVILVDFVSMHARYRPLLMHALEERAQVDVRLRVVDMTALGIVEMTRRKV